MVRSTKRKPAAVALRAACLALAATAPNAHAADGVIEVSQARVLAGGVAPGDKPGYPLTIDASGSYRLTGDLQITGLSGAALSIEIVPPARDVVLDLGGFTVDGGGACSPVSPIGATCSLLGLPNGIGSTASAQIVIRNGTIRGLRSGIVVSTAASVTVEDLRTTEHTNSGVFVASGIPAVVRQVVASTTAGRGIDLGSAGSVIDSIADHNANIGIRAADVAGSRASANASTGIDASFDGARVSESWAFGNAVRGIGVGAGGTVSGSRAHDNPVGIAAGAGASVVSSTMRDNTSFGLSAAADASYAGCTLTGNNGGGNNAQVSGGVQLGTNFCGTDTVCP